MWQTHGKVAHRSKHDVYFWGKSIYSASPALINVWLSWYLCLNKEKTKFGLSTAVSYSTLSWFLRLDVIFFLQRERKKNVITDDYFCCFMNSFSWVHADTHSAILTAADSCLQKVKNDNSGALCSIYRLCARLRWVCEWDQLSLVGSVGAAETQTDAWGISFWNHLEMVWDQETVSAQLRLLCVWLNLVWLKNRLTTMKPPQNGADHCFCITLEVTLDVRKNHLLLHFSVAA